MTDDQLDLLFKALSDRTRRRIIDRLSKQSGQSLFEVCSASVAEDGVALSRQTVSQHLDVLERAGLIKTSWKGRTKAHSLSVDEAHAVAANWINNYKVNGAQNMKIYVTNVFVDDQDKAKKFYCDVLGFKVKSDVPIGQHRWLTVVSSEQLEGTELLLEPSDHPAIKPYKDALVGDCIPAHSFQVKDLDAERKRLGELKVNFVQEPMDAGPVRIAVFDDTCGNLIQLIEMTDTAKA